MMRRSVPNDLRPRLAPLLLLLGAVPLHPQASAPGPLPLAGPTRGTASNLLLDELEGGSLVARLNITWEEEQLCVRVAIRPEPRALAPGNFTFVRYLDVDGRTSTAPLRLKFNRKPDSAEEGVVPEWRSCIGTQRRLESAVRDDVQVTVREPARGAVRPTERYFLPFPSDGSKAHLILRRDPQGKLYSTDS